MRTNNPLWRTRTIAYDFAISLRFGETNDEMVALKNALVARGYRVFLCNEAPGVNLKKKISGVFSACDMAIIAASATYGRKTTSGFSTYEEMNFIQSEGTPYFLLKMTAAQDLNWEEDVTRGTYNMDLYQYWKPGTPMPNDLVDNIVKKLLEVRGQPRPSEVVSPLDDGQSPDRGSHAGTEAESLN